ncbi:MAG: hypothetical protein ABI391_07825 [Hyphomicrobiaceae bacterium]
MAVRIAAGTETRAATDPINAPISAAISDQANDKASRHRRVRQEQKHRPPRQNHPASAATMAADGIATVAATAARARARARAMEHPHRLRQIARARQLRESAGRAGRIAGRIAEKTVAPSVVLAMIAIAVMAAAGPRATAGATIAARNAMTGSTR